MQVCFGTGECPLPLITCVQHCMFCVLLYDLGLSVILTQTIKVCCSNVYVLSKANDK